MSAASSRPDDCADRHPILRIRTVLLVIGIVLGALWAIPRARAAVDLHGAANAFADYALCMVGPTGPSLLRDSPEAFRSLVTRRLLVASPEERPFLACAPLARRLTGSEHSETAHSAPAWHFAEYGTPDSETGQSGRAVGDLRVTTRLLAELSGQAWPFERDGYTELIRPTSSALEAIHPVEFPRPAAGNGLPRLWSPYRSVHASPDGALLAVGSGANLRIYETGDGGINWVRRAVSARHLHTFAERCPAGQGRSFTFGLSSDGGLYTVTSWAPDAEPHTAELAPSRFTVFSSACDATAMVVGLRADAPDRTVLVWCGLGGPCRPLRLPRILPSQTDPRYPFDVARASGVTVLAVAMGNVVRVASSRDDGQTWTPFVVAYHRDGGEGSDPAAPLPDRLLALGDRVLLYAGALQPNQTYPVLESSDYGATWRTPTRRSRTALASDLR